MARVQADGAVAFQDHCAHLSPVIAPGQSVELSCRVTLSASSSVTLMGQDPRTHHQFVHPSGVEVHTVPVVAAAGDPAAPLSIQRSVETYVGSGQYGGATYGSTATRIRVVNGPQPTTSVVVVDTAGTCSKSRGRAGARRGVDLPVHHAAPQTGQSSTLSVAAVRGVEPSGAITPAADSTTVSNPALTAPPDSLPATGGAPTFALVGSAFNRIKRHFVGAMALVTLLSALLLAYDRWAVQPSREVIPVPDAGSGEPPGDDPGE